MFRQRLRVSEACGLVLSQVDMESRVLHIERPKLPPSSSQVAMATKLYTDQTNSIADICKTLHISRATLSKYIQSGGGNVAPL